ncbi:MAG TPA: alkaline phosphatase family protein, partial [bacterium]|nr:alkaline phosphatase family protein [bacterium]
MRRRFAAPAFFLLALAACARPHPQAPPESASPVAHRALVVVIDQLRADLVDRGDMPNLKRLRERGAYFPDAYVGHVAAKTVVSHGVLTRGVFPRRLGWEDDAFRDVGGVLGPKNQVWISELKLEQFQKVLPSDLPPSSVAAYLEHPKHVFIGEKDYAVAAMAGNEADIDITFGKADPKTDGAEWKGWLKPVGLNVPAYIRGTPGSRFWVDGRKTYGTEASSYSLGGDKFVPGDDPAHRGGDVWAADAALAVIEHEDFGIMFVTFGGVDKVSHMMGSDHDLDAPNPSPIKLAEQLHTADAQLGRLLDALDAKGIAAETAVVVTADHGGMYAEHLHA